MYKHVYRTATRKAIDARQISYVQIVYMHESRGRFVLMCRCWNHGENDTLPEVARRLGVTAERVRQIEYDTIQRLRRNYV
jgi:DNA-directed RNA polymerase sigma subunit (sigma70/sigma32)